VYHFPELRLQHPSIIQPVPQYHRELKERFSAASSGQILLSAGLGVLNFVGPWYWEICWQMALPPSWVDLSPCARNLLAVTGLWFGFFGRAVGTLFLDSMAQ